MNALKYDATIVGHVADQMYSDRNLPFSASHYDGLVRFGITKYLNPVAQQETIDDEVITINKESLNLTLNLLPEQ